MIISYKLMNRLEVEGRVFLLDDQRSSKLLNIIYQRDMNNIITETPDLVICHKHLYLLLVSKYNY